MIGIGANRRRAYGIKHYNVDTESDILKIPVNTNMIGSTCFVISSSKYYMLNGNYQWVEISPFGVSSSTGGDGGSDDDLIYDGGLAGPEDPPDDVIYEGGII